MMFLAQLFVKMPHAEIEVLLAIEVQHLLDDLHFHPPRAGPRRPPVIQPVEAHAAIGVEQPPQMPRADPQNPRRFPERQLLAPQPQNHFFSFHSPLPGARWVPHGRSSGLLVYPAWPSPRADISLANSPDISCANDNPPFFHCAAPSFVLTIGVNIAPMPAPTRSSRQIPPVSPKCAKRSGEFLIPVPKRRKLLEKTVTPPKSATSQFLIDKNLPSLTISAPANLFFPSPAASFSNRNSKKLKSHVSYRKQRTCQFLIATFRALFSPEQAHFASRFHATPSATK